jgi:hypothetical protein
MLSMLPALRKSRRVVVGALTAAGSADAGGAEHSQDCPLAGTAEDLLSIATVVVLLKDNSTPEAARA